MRASLWCLFLRIRRLVLFRLHYIQIFGCIILNINNIDFDIMVSQIYPSELQLNKANTFDTKPRFWTSICPFLMILFLPKFTINVTFLILKLSISHFRWWCSSLYILSAQSQSGALFVPTACYMLLWYRNYRKTLYFSFREVQRVCFKRTNSIEHHWQNMFFASEQKLVKIFEYYYAVSFEKEL